ncbi:tyrosine-protein phosphatase [Oligoflexus tunisiensis]|uniref:tyrosine-protein phosphatase n=1 Tax=Oligoflexus tunisiensis TaxID=708132 RepID=UPI00114D01A6|nr:tyrosine-protein phosphatase [Oligoflexus tunisiensis]
MRGEQLNDLNFMEKVYRFEDRQAGVSLIYDPDDNIYTYNAYCLETHIMKELFTVEQEYLDDALDLINAEFGSWELVDLSGKSSGCGSCAAK